MNTADLLALRLYNTGLSTSPFRSAHDAVTHLGAVQAQDFAAATWALGLRVKNAIGRDIEESFNRGTILRTHVLRPTWHFVTPENIRWMLELTAPRVKAVLGHYNRKLDLDDGVVSRSNAIVVKALEGRNYLTRQELKAELEEIGIRTDVQRLAHLIVQAELDGLVCSGPRRGKQFTYALLDERVGNVERLSDRDEALSRLALIYFRGHGPARGEDFAWWSGLSQKEVKETLSRIGPSLNHTVLKGKTYWHCPLPERVVPEAPHALLLSLYDEYTIAYKDRSDLSGTRDIERMISMGNALTAVIILDGKVAGTWRKNRKKNGIGIRLNPFRDFSPGEHAALEREIARYGNFLGMPVVLET